MENLDNVDNVNTENNVEGTDNNQPKGGEGKEPETKVVFDELDDSIKRFIDQERTKASKTAREKAVKDPQLRESIRQQLKKEAQMSAEEKLRIQEEEIMKKTSELSAREYLMKEGNLFGEDLEDGLAFVVSTDKDATLAKSEKYVETLNKMITKATQREVTRLTKQPKPKTKSTQPKAFKDMSFDERVKLKEADPARYKAEMAKVQSKI